MPRQKKAKAKTKSVKTMKKATASKSAAKKTKKPVKTVKKTKKVLSQPKGYSSVTPYLIVDNAKKAIEFYKKAFSAKELFRMDAPDGKVRHAELKIGDAKIMLGDECSEKGSKSPKQFGGSPMSIYLYVKNVDATMKSAVAAGATVIREAQDMFYGDRSGGLQDNGIRLSINLWYIANFLTTHQKDVVKERQGCKIFGAHYNKVLKRPAWNLIKIGKFENV